MSDDPLKRPLVFGDTSQIQALQDLALAKEFEGMVDCEKCKGIGKCRCGNECAACDGCGKDPNLYEQFRRLHPKFVRSSR